MYKVTLRVNELPPLNVSADRHWLARISTRKRWAWLLREALGRQPRPPEPLKRANLVCIRCSSVEPEYENIVSSFKPILDCLRSPSRTSPDGLGIIADDNLKSIGIPIYGWDRVRRGQGHVVITIEEAEQGEPSESKTDSFRR